MSLRWKIASALAAVTLLATVAIGLASYRTTRARLYGEIDRSLAGFDLRELRGGGSGNGDARIPDRGPLDGLAAQLVAPDGTVVESTFPGAPAVSAAARAVIGERRASVYETVLTEDGNYRVRTVGLPRGAVQIGRSLDETDRVLRTLRARTLVFSLLVAGVSIASGLWIAGRVTRSLRRLTVAAEHVETTGRLDATVGIGGADEVGRLGAAFDRMLVALARSKQDQQRLVQDAGHELRTPLTSLRTNVDTLRRFRDLPNADRDAIVADLHAETEELTDLVNEIVAVASGSIADEPAEEFDLAALAEESAARYERRTGRPIVVVGEPSYVAAQRGAVQRAISCLLDNACKFDDSGAPIEVTVEVTVDGASVSVADRGAGIPAHELALIFDRFHRAEEARSLPGSGLGLAIVRETAERHGGEAFAGNREGGGAVVGFRLGA